MLIYKLIHEIKIKNTFQNHISETKSYLIGLALPTENILPTELPFFN